MSTILFSNQSYLERSNEKASLTDRKVILENHLRQTGSAEAALELASLTEHHQIQIQDNDHTQASLECEKHCDHVAAYYLCAISHVRQKYPIECTPALLEIVKQSAELIKAHVEISKMKHLAWVPLLVGELREIGKQVKDEGSESDRLVSLGSCPNINETPVQGKSSVDEEYRRAIRITIYYCRAALCEQSDLDKSIAFYRKCVSVRPTQLEPQQSLQETAKAALQHLIADQENYSKSVRPTLPSRSSSVSSSNSSSCAVSCGNCGVEKRGMPVCSKCKAQYYCGARCLKAHKPVHDLECSHR
jgi:hypothetical protein